MHKNNVLIGIAVYILTLSVGPVQAGQKNILALGDSYTIGQGVEEQDRWPNQLGEELKKLGVPVGSVKIAARTGWTTHDLLSALEREEPPHSYDLVLLLIGVNDQFQRRPVESFQEDFKALLKKAVLYAHDRPANVIVVSIPDWGVSPFGRETKLTTIAQDIDRFNQLEKTIAENSKVHWVNITDRSRETTDPSMYTQDGLHPAQRMYATWVKIITPVASQILMPVQADNPPPIK